MTGSRLLWVPESFCFVLFCGDSGQQSRDRERASEKKKHARSFTIVAHCRRKQNKKTLAPMVAAQGAQAKVIIRVKL